MSLRTPRRGPITAGIVPCEPVVAPPVLGRSGHCMIGTVTASVWHAVEAPGLWTPGLDVALNLKVGEAGGHRPLEISPASAADHACAGAARFPYSHSASSSWL